MGVQEINIVPMVAPITKYAVQVRDPETIRVHLDHALHYAIAGRPGPVWLDIPADVQNAEIDPASLAGVAPWATKPINVSLRGQVAELVELLRAAKRPLVHIGQGARPAELALR